MAFDRNKRRLPLRELLSIAEKHTRDLIEKVGSTWISRATDLRDLSRPHRKRSPYPTLVALKHAIEKLLQMNDETSELLSALTLELEEIRDHARREKINRP